MKNKPSRWNLLSYFTGLIVMLMLIFSCGEGGDDTVPNPSGPVDPNAIKIMPLGASRVEGARPDFESYRYELWKLMVDQGWNFDFIGTMRDGSSYPAHANQNFDNDHEGRGGWTSGQIRQGISTWLSEAGAPDIVLLSSPGGNDGLNGSSFSQAVDNINAIIDAIQAVNPNVTIIIEQMAPAHSSANTSQLESYMLQMNQAVLTMATEQSTNTSKVLTVDMNSGFTDSLLADDVHYNEAGAAFIAQRYFNVLRAEFSSN